ncbi:phage terminase large subunit [Ornithinimicrobium sp. LYQ92]|uniref:phage terminase large subunit n=1 Tax=Serinicoccus sp. LYQ92 TaxID=3378798 RepID=UPI003853B7D1
MTLTTDWAEHAARHFEPPARRWTTPGDLARHINPGTVQTPALDLIDAALVHAANTPDARLIISMPPQEGKSTRAAGDFPAWVLTQNPDTRIVTASYGQSLANRNGRAIRRRITSNPDLGLTLAADNGAAHEWEIDGHQGGVFSVGVGGGITGRAADLLIIDDPIKDRAQADSPTYRENVWDWWTDAASARLAPGAAVVLILTRWHHDDLAGRLLDRDKDAGWVELNIPAQCDNPDTDPLGRAQGEFMVSARGRTRAQWEQRKKTAGIRTWASLYQGRPTPDTGNLFPADQWARYDLPQWIVRSDGAHIVPEVGRDEHTELVQSWDMAFKDTTSSDYVVGQIWLRRGTRAFLLDQVRGRWGFTQTVQAVKDLTAKWPQATAKLVEDKANGPAVMNSLRGTVGGLVPVEPEGSKYARAVAITPLVEADDVLLPDPLKVEGTAWVTDLTEEARDFPGAAHDDTVDAATQAVHRLLLVPILDTTTHGATDLLDDLEDQLDWAPTY